VLRSCGRTAPEPRCPSSAASPVGAAPVVAIGTGAGRASRPGHHVQRPRFDGLYRASASLLSELREPDQTMLLTILRRYRQVIDEHTAGLRAEGARGRAKR
jgi:hypothetical protein